MSKRKSHLLRGYSSRVGLIPLSTVAEAIWERREAKGSLPLQPRPSYRKPGSPNTTPRPTVTLVVSMMTKERRTYNVRKREFVDG